MRACVRSFVRAFVRAFVRWFVRSRNLFRRSHEHSEPLPRIIYGYGSVPFISSVVL